MLVSRLCLGTFNFGTVTDDKEAFRIMDAALDEGINFFDTANHYPDFVNCGRTEQYIGRWLAQGNGRREKTIIATKVYQPMEDPFDGPNNAPGLSAYKIRRHIEGSLTRLQTDHIELYQMHHIDRRVSWEEVWEAFDRLQKQGKIDYVGSSNFAAWHLTLAQAAAREKHMLGLVSEQHRYNLDCRLPELEVLPSALAQGIGILPYHPFAGGLLAGDLANPPKGSRRESLTDEYGRRKKTLHAYTDLCREMGESEPTIAVAWLLAQPAVTSVIVGPRTVDQLESITRAVEAKLDDEVLSRLDELFPGPGGAAPEAYSW